MSWCFAPVKSKHDACRDATEFAVANSVLDGIAPRSFPCEEKYIIFQPVCPYVFRGIFIFALKNSILPLAFRVDMWYHYRRLLYDYGGWSFGSFL